MGTDICVANMEDPREVQVKVCQTDPILFFTECFGRIDRSMPLFDDYNERIIVLVSEEITKVKEF